ncbi:DUF72 domain-containing protein, partial [Chryseobacterium sp.]|uniref:DUF72 domain-containing protein n=1 Tax=Chryseobacterium sp. TaxID=1871047 RepID=UPI00289AA809
LKENKIVVSGLSLPGNLTEDVIINHPASLYYRIHGKPVLYKSEYSEEFLEDLAKKNNTAQHKTFIFFNNTWGTSAVKNGLYLKSILE